MHTQAHSARKHTQCSHIFSHTNTLRNTEHQLHILFSLLERISACAFMDFASSPTSHIFSSALQRRCMYVYAYTCTCKHMYMYVFSYIDVWIYVFLCLIYIYIYIYIYICTFEPAKHVLSWPHRMNAVACIYMLVHVQRYTCQFIHQYA